MGLKEDGQSQRLTMPQEKIGDIQMSCVKGGKGFFSVQCSDLEQAGEVKNPVPRNVDFLLSFPAQHVCRVQMQILEWFKGIIGQHIRQGIKLILPQNQVNFTAPLRQRMACLEYLVETGLSGIEPLTDRVYDSQISPPHFFRRLSRSERTKRLIPGCDKTSL